MKSCKVVGFFALGGESVTGWQIGEKIREIFPFWDNGSRICSLLLAITAALTNFKNIFTQDSSKAAHWTVNLENLKNANEILEAVPDQENFIVAGRFRKSLRGLVDLGFELKEMSPRQIQAILLERTTIEDTKSVELTVKSDTEDTEPPAKKSLSDEGYNSPNRKYHEVKPEIPTSPINYLQNFSRFPQMVQNSAFTNLQLMKTASLLQSNPFYPQVPAFYSMLPFLNHQNAHVTPFLMGEGSRQAEAVSQNSPNDERKYTRHAKPPYSYSSIIMLALLTDEARALPLREIVRR